MEKRSAGKLALFGLIIAVLSFVQLLGLERAILGVVMCSIALTDPNENKVLAWIGISVGIISAVVLLVIVLWKFPHLTGLMKGNM